MDQILVDDVRFVPRGHVLAQLVECSPGLGSGFLGAVECPRGLQDHRGVISQRREQGDLICGKTPFPTVGGKQDSEDLAVGEHRHAENRNQTPRRRSRHRPLRHGATACSRCSSEPIGLLEIRQSR